MNFLDDDEHDRVREPYGERTYQRLVALTNRWDPANAFQVNQNITPRPLYVAS